MHCQGKCIIIDYELIENIKLTTKKIYDEFSDLPVSRQRKAQMRNKEKGLCEQCGSSKHTKYPRHYKKEYNKYKKIERSKLYMELKKHYSRKVSYKTDISRVNILIKSFKFTGQDVL